MKNKSNTATGQKTIIEWLKTLGHPYRKLAIKNCKTSNKNKLVYDAMDAVETAFNWMGSPEGYDYWNTYWNYLCDKDDKDNAVKIKIPIKKKSKFVEFTTEELNVIAKALNILKIQTPQAMGVSMNTYHMTRFYNETHYIDSAGTFKVYKKYKGWKPNEEKTW